VGLLVYSWLSYMNPHRITWGAAYSFPFAMIVAATTVVAWLLSKEPKRIPWCGVTVLLVAFVLWINITTLFALVPDSAWEKWDTVMKIMFMTFLTLALATTRQRIHALVWVIVVSIGFYGIRGGIFVLLTGGNYLTFGPPSSFIEANNALGLALIMILPLMRYLQLHTANRWLRWGMVGAMGLSLLSVLASYSRGAVVALAVMLVFFLVKSRRRLMIGSLSVLALAIGLVFMPQKWVERVESTKNYEQDASVQGRFDAWIFAINIARDRPVLGGGFKVDDSEEIFMRYSPYAARVRSFHSNYFEVLGEHGFVGLFIYLLLGLTTLRMGTVIRKRVGDNPDLAWARDLATMLQVGLIGYAVGGAFLNKAFFDLYYHMIALMVVTDSVVRTALAASEESSTTLTVTSTPAQAVVSSGPST